MPKVESLNITIRPLLTALISSFLLFACGETNPINTEKTGLIYCSEGNPSTFNPQLATSGTTADASSYQIYDRLLEFDPETNKIVPGLASHWQVSKDGLTYTFTLRKEVHFHSTQFFKPTREFNADDVIFSMDRWRNWDHPYHDVSGGNYPYFASLELDNLIDAIYRVDSHKIKITLSKPDSSFLANLATDFAIVLSAEYGDFLLNKGTPELIDEHPIGTGPFQFIHHQKDRYIRYKKNANYWRDIPLVDQLIFDITPLSSLRLAKLMTGECDVLSLPAHSELEIIRERENLILDEKPGLNVGFWAFNTSRAPFDNIEVRKALAMAIDKSALVEAVYFGSAVKANGIVPPSSWAHQSDLQGTSYNPILAKELLKKNGIEDGFTLDIWAMPVERTYNPNAVMMAGLMQGFLKDVGVNVNIVSFEWNSFRRRLAEGNYDSILIGWSADNGDPDNFYRPLLSCPSIDSGTNRAKWCSPQFDELINEALTYSDERTRVALYQSANAIIADQIPLVPIAHAYRYQAYRSNVNDLVINPFGGIRFGGVYKQ
ncbi:ABC transporter substrate-binding protein [Alteromonas sp. a30]|uniref:ABC transporter substrate-binding protein n=1 Tax=Alteromonas sp. a30 TaxID=2730917 RepID=UPI00227E38F5|nr:ABC transporter substrate-binding protein [Alteromonas sp. a30]MCY7295973.1 ABC transporter substrate-binding protein [Alteromonas sp. a30]